MVKRGRKPLDYEHYQKDLVNVLSSGATIKDACAFVGISSTQYYDWCHEYVEFAEALSKARASAKVACVAQIRKAAQSNWQAAAWFLERSDPTSWGRKDMLIQLGIDPSLLKQLKQSADGAGVDLGAVFEAMITELGQVIMTERLLPDGSTGSALY